MTQIIARIPREGLSKGDRKIEFEVAGLKGESCTNVTKAFEQALSQAPAHTELKAEFYEQEERREFLNLD